jgi:hypothetical protein
LCLTIDGAPLQDPLHEGMWFVATHYTKVATWLSALWTAVCLAAKSMLGHILAEVLKVNVVGEMVVMFRE